MSDYEISIILERIDVQLSRAEYLTDLIDANLQKKMSQTN